MAGSSSSVPPFSWLDLPRDLTENILRRLGPVEILQSAQNVCTTWWTVCHKPSLWGVIVMKKSDRPASLDAFFCQIGVNRSQGDLRMIIKSPMIDLTDIIMEDLASDDLLQYISDRCSRLKRLSLEVCFYSTISEHGLTTAVKSFAHLEELHIQFVMSQIVNDFDLECIGTSCPLLKSLLFNNNTFIFSGKFRVNNRYALAIAKSMPNLRCLSIIGNCLNNEGLEAILRACPNLESLNLCDCINVDLKCDVVRTGLERIKDWKWNPEIRRSRDPAYYEAIYDSMVNFDPEDGWDDALYDESEDGLFGQDGYGEI